MIIHPDFIYVANPRTASRATEAVLKDILGDAAQVTKQHHPKTNHSALKRDVPIYGVVREPLEWIVSWYHHTKRPVPFPQFVKEYKNGWLFNSRLTIYAPYITHLCNYNALGVEGVVRAIVGFDRYTEWERSGGSVPVIGRTGPELDLWTDRLAQSARSRFPSDFLLYEATDDIILEVRQGDTSS